MHCITIGCMDEGDGAGDVDGDNYYGDLQEAGHTMAVMVMKRQWPVPVLVMRLVIVMMVICK